MKPVRIVVIIEDHEPSEQCHIFDILKTLPSHQLFQNAEEVDAYMREEHDAWER